MVIRIREARERARITQRQLARRLGISPAALCGYENGSHDPKPEALRLIAACCGVTVDYLLGAEAPPAAAGLSDEALDVARAYDELDLFGRNAVAAVMEAERLRVASQTRRAAARKAAGPNDPIPLPAASPAPGAIGPKADRTVRLRTYESPAAAGSPNPAESAYTEVDYPAALVPANARFAVGISGDSMEPEIPDGSTVLLGEADHLYDGDVVVAWLDGAGAVCKRICLRGETVTRLMSANRACADYTGDSLRGLRVFGKVLGVIRPEGAAPAAVPMRMTDRERGAALKARRVRLGLSPQDVCAAAHVGEHALRRWEDGRESAPPDAVRRLCEALDADPFVFA